jgi:uncharacterized protein YggE
MNKNQTIFAVIAICLSIIFAGVIVAYKPWLPAEEPRSEFRFPTGTGTSLGLAANTFQGEGTDAKTISLTGSGVSSATANEATVILGVQTEDESAKEAIEDNAVLMVAVISAIKDLGFSDEEIKTVSYNVRPNYDWEIDKVTGYTVTNMIKIEIDNLDLVGDVIDAAGVAGANRVDGVTFELSEDLKEQLKLDAYVAAIQDAEAKANVITETMDLEIIGVQSVTEISYASPRVFAEFDEVAPGISAPGAPTPIIEGSLSITVQLHIVYLIA